MEHSVMMCAEYYICRSPQTLPSHPGPSICLDTAMDDKQIYLYLKAILDLSLMLL